MNKGVVVRDHVADKNYVVLSVQGGRSSTVVDYDDFAMMSGLTWIVNNTYVCESTSKKYLLAFVMGRVNNMSVDHVNQIKTDNRRCNLRQATQSQQNVNRDHRSDRYDPPTSLKDTGIHVMPRFIRWDPTCQRYTLADAPFAPKTLNSTRSAQCSHEGRYLDCLKKYIAAMDAMDPLVLEADMNECDARRKSATEYVAIARAAHDYDAALFPVPDVLPRYRSLHMELALAKEQHAYLVQKGVTICRGAPNQQSQYGMVTLGDGTQIGTVVKGGNIILYDTAFAEAVRNVALDIDASSVRVRVDGGRMPLATFIWTRCAMRSIPEGKCVVPVNFERYDARLSNLKLIDGKSGKSAKRSAVTDVPDGVDIGMPFLPLEVTIRRDKGSALQVRADGNSQNFKNHGNTMQEALTDAINALRRGPEFDATNSVYQSRMREFREATRLAKNSV